LKPEESLGKYAWKIAGAFLSCGATNWAAFRRASGAKRGNLLFEVITSLQRRQ
jgi:hypothetical protein